MRIVLLMYHVSVHPIPEMINNKKAVPLNDFDQYLAELAHRVRGYNG